MAFFHIFQKPRFACHEGEHVGSGSCAACYAVVGGSYFYRGFACPTCQQVAMGFTMGFLKVAIAVPPKMLVGLISWKVRWDIFFENWGYPHDKTETSIELDLPSGILT